MEADLQYVHWRWSMNGKSKSSWVRARKVPDDEGELRKMFALAVSDDVKVVMNNQLFRYRDKFYCQHEGG